jgi:hypothetical protein
VALELRQDKRAWILPAALLLARAGGGEVHPLLPEFRAATLAAPGRPRLLDIGGRARSGIQRSDGFPHCDTTVLDIIAAPGVDVVADAHASCPRICRRSISTSRSASPSSNTSPCPGRWPSRWRACCGRAGSRW